jgi:hypothetical protein
MSVSNRFYTIDWTRIHELPATDHEFWSIRSEISESDDPWIGGDPFGEGAHPFEYFSGLMEFLEWFQEARESMPKRVVKDFTSVFRDIGILYGDDEYAPTPIKKDVALDWVTGAIPPADCADILRRLGKIDREATKEAFAEANENESCDICEDGERVLEWIDLVEDALKGVVGQDRGILLVIA